MAGGDDPRCAIGLGEVVERPHHVGHELVMRVGHRVDALVAVERLGGFSRTDLDSHRGAELVVAEHAV